jgi:hypothetical protein
VTVGDPLTAALSPSTIDSKPITVFNSALPEAGAYVTSPVSGTIVRWRLDGASGGPFKLRVLRPADGPSYTGAGTSASQIPNSAGTVTFSTNLPIQAGDTVGLDAAGGSKIGIATSGGSIAAWSPPLDDRETSGITATVDNLEVGFNADVATAPSNEFTFGKAKRKKRSGAALVPVSLPGPGSLALSGTGVKVMSTGAGVTAAGTVSLRVKPKGAVRKRLSRRGKAMVGISATYTPTGGDVPGVPKTQSTRIKLIKRGRS